VRVDPPQGSGPHVCPVEGAGVSGACSGNWHRVAPAFEAPPAPPQSPAPTQWPVLP